MVSVCLVAGLTAAAERGSVCSLQPGLSVGSVPPPAHPPLPQQPFPEPAMSFAPVLPPPSAPVPTGPGQPTAPAHQVSAGYPPYGCHGCLGLPRPCLSILAGLSPGPVNLLAVQAPCAPSLKFPRAWGVDGSGDGCLVSVELRVTHYLEGPHSTEWSSQICVSWAPGWMFEHVSLWVCVHVCCV